MLSYGNKSRTLVQKTPTVTQRTLYINDGYVFSIIIRKMFPLLFFKAFSSSSIPLQTSLLLHFMIFAV